MKNFDTDRNGTGTAEWAEKGGEMNWQPIETAPKDRRILLYYPQSPFTDCNNQFGRWDDDKYTAKPLPHWSNDQSRLWGRTDLKKICPTHWMPLPDPPK